MATFPPTHHIVTIMGESYDIYSRRFEQQADNLPAISTFWSNFKRAVATHTRSNIFSSAQDNIVYGESLHEQMIGWRIQHIPYPYDLGVDQNGYPVPNPPPPTSEDWKAWSFICKEKANQNHEDNKALQMFWNWIGDYRQRTLRHIYKDETKTPRRRLQEIEIAHLSYLRGHTSVIIARYKAQWALQCNNNCTSLESAIDNLHLLQNINTNIYDLDPTTIITALEMMTLIIPTLHHDNFSILVENWNRRIELGQPTDANSLQPQLERCFISKASLNNAHSYAHVGTNKEKMTLAAKTMDLTPTKTSYAASTATPHSPSLDDWTDKLTRIVDEAFKRRDRDRRSNSSSASPGSRKDQRSNSSSVSPSNRDSSRSRSRDTNDRRNQDRRPRDSEKDRYPNKSNDSRSRDRSRSNDSRRDSYKPPDRPLKETSPARAESPKKTK